MFSTNFMKRCLGGVLLLTSIVAGTFLFAFSTANTTGAVTTTAVALQSNNIVGTKAAYDIIFKTVSSGSIKTVLILFMKDTDVTGSIIPEVKGLGPGSTSPGPQGVFRFLNNCLAISYATVSGPNVVKIGFHLVPYPPANICHNLIALGPSTLSVIVFRP